ncbi:MAG: recombinase family protein [Trebonia sp.]
MSPRSKAHATWGRRAHRLEPDPETAHVVRWIFAKRLAGHSVARIARALNEAGVPCPSAADPQRNPHRAGTGWALGTVTTILQNPRYTGHQVWNRQRTDKDLADPADVSLDIKACSGGTCPTAWSSPTSPRTRLWWVRPITSPPRTSAPPAAPRRAVRSARRKGEWNKNPKPFVWTKTADEILETLAAYGRRVSSQER